jgi:dihydroorotase
MPACGIKIFMGSQHGALLIDDETSLDPIFGSGTRLIAVHAEDQARIADRRLAYTGTTDPAMHSVIQDNQAAVNATLLALKFSKKYQRRLHILHLSTGEEALILREDKPDWVTAEVTPQHLILSIDDYDALGTLWYQARGTLNCRPSAESMMRWVSVTTIVHATGSALSK